MTYVLPDPQHLELDALHALAHKMQDEHKLPPGAFEGEPESVVFTADSFDDYMDEDAFESIRLVGARDVDEKIHYWRTLLDEAIQADETYTDDHYDEIADMYAMEAAERAAGC